VVVFLVALPLCMGAAITSGVSPMAGLITGIVGGLIVRKLHRRRTSVQRGLVY
jgi:MFS superfamily sulfate permease-like transporter